MTILIKDYTMSEHNKNRRKSRTKPQQDRGTKGRRAVVIHEGRKVVVTHPNPGYDVTMVRDFLDHLLLEVRVQHCENVRARKELDATGDINAAYKAVGKPTQAVAEQFAKYQKKYAAALVPANRIDCTNASDDEVRAVVRQVIPEIIARREEQIGHLEALQSLFDEALKCARVAFAPDRNGNLVEPVRPISVREVIDSSSTEPN
jgi:hypothetical protein